MTASVYADPGPMEGAVAGVRDSAECLAAAGEVLSMVESQIQAAVNRNGASSLGQASRSFVERWRADLQVIAVAVVTFDDAVVQAATTYRSGENELTANVEAATLAGPLR